MLLTLMTEGVVLLLFDPDVQVALVAGKLVAGHWPRFGGTGRYGDRWSAGTPAGSNSLRTVAESVSTGSAIPLLAVAE